MKYIKKIFILLLCCILAQGCAAKEYKVEEQEITSIAVSKKSYTLANQTLNMIEKSKYEEADEVFLVKNEEELAKVLEYNISHSKDKVAFQSKHKMDMDKTANYLSYIEPYDISLVLSTTEYKNQKGKKVYQSNVVEIKNLDNRYEETKIVANQIYDKIITPNMDNNQKIKAIHDYLAETTIYNEISIEDSALFPNVFKAAGALIDKNAVCAGYSRAFLIMAKLADIPAIYVASDAMDHGWNMVYGNDGWRYIDITWDDPVPDAYGIAEQTFLNMSIDEFLKEGSHIFDNNKQSDYFLNVAEMYFSEKQRQ